MDVKLHIFECGKVRMDKGLVYPNTERGTDVLIPVICGLVEHDGRRLLFDTGLHPDVITDPVGRWGDVTRFAMPIMQEGEDITSRLAAAGISEEQIEFVANSHLHNDHAGCNQFFPHSTFLIQRLELEAARDPELRAKLGFDPRDWDHAVVFQPEDGEYDVFGDGSAVLFPTPGHTPGHQSLFVRVSSGRSFVLTGDAAYVRENVEQRTPVRISWDKEKAKASLGVISSRLSESHAELLCAHDPVQWGGLQEGHTIYS